MVKSASRPLAFSLIEVVLALGVIAFALVAILGVFPTGLAANRSSISDTRASQLLSAITATIDAQCTTFSNVTCYGTTLDLASLDTATAAKTLYVSYPSPNQPTISNNANLTSWIYTVELTFDNNPALTSTGTKLGPGKLNKIQLRLRGKSTTEGFVEGFYLARNRG
jgi:uncharacterized protein (TIGR02598 family)